MRQRVASSLPACLALLLPGCAFFTTMFAIGGGVLVEREYREGVGIQDYRATIQDVWNACREEMDELGIRYNKEFQFDFEKGSHIPVTDGWVEINPHPKDDRYTRVRARFGGGKEKSAARAAELLDGVDARLGGASAPEM